MKTNPALSALRHHVTGAIARGEAQAITEVPASPRAAHTPGPWYLNPRGWVVQSTGDIVTRLECSNNKEADARLIASAPELIEALAGCADALREAGKDFAQANRLAARPNLYELHEQAARAAIAKARG